MLDPLVITVVVLLIVSGVAWGVLQLRQSDEPTTFDRVLKLFALPLLGLGLLLLIVSRANAATPGRMEGDDDLEPDESTDPEEDRETQAEQVRRVLEDEADRVEEHIIEKATDDEVAARGAALFDPEG